MGKAERQRKKSVKRDLNNRVKAALKTGRHLSVCSGPTGEQTNLLHYVFSPGMSAELRREGEQTIVDYALSKPHGSIRMVFEEHDSYPVELYASQIECEELKPLFVPHLISYALKLNGWPQQVGVFGGVAFRNWKKMKLPERAFVPALKLMQKIGVYTILANGTIWRPEDVKEKFGYNYKELKL